MKKHEIKTFDDMINAVTEENIDRFLADLKNILLHAKIFKEVYADELVSDSFIWNDDGKNKIDVIIDEKKK
jgi:hypothetical protein